MYNYFKDFWVRAMDWAEVNFRYFRAINVFVSLSYLMFVIFLTFFIQSFILYVLILLLNFLLLVSSILSVTIDIRRKELIDKQDIKEGIVMCFLMFLLLLVWIFKM